MCSLLPCCQCQPIAYRFDSTLCSVKAHICSLLRVHMQYSRREVPGDEFDEGAEDFFQRVMDETNTQITWPSKLKIGAKSKKDPHIKVIGFPDDVRAAKAKIMSILDTKSNRVTLKMDVSHTEHSHVIGKGGNNIKRVMMETGCHIHFPDSNRGNNVQEKSNQVSIAGQPAGVENARAQIRELLPLVFMFELPTTPAVLQAAQDSSSVVVQQLQQVYNVTISFKQRPRMPVTTVLVRGSVINAKSVKEATAKLMETFTGMANLVVSMHLEIAPQHHLFIIGRQGSNVKSIMQSTNSSILFPDPSTSGPQRKGTVVIRGSIESVFCARQHLIGCLPLVLMFDVKEDIELEQGRLTQLMEQLDVFISVKPKPKQPSKSVIVKSIERNARNMYLARLLLLGLHPEGLSGSLLKAASNNAHGTTGLGLTSLGFLNSHSLLNVSTPSSLVLVNGHTNPQSPSLGSPLSATNLSPSHWLHGNPGLFSPLMVVTPASTVPASFDVLPQCNGFQKDFAPASPFIRVPAQQNKGPSSNTSESASPPAQSPCDSPQSVMGFRHGTTVELGGLQSEDSMENVITRDTSTLSSSGHTLDLLGLSKTTPVTQPPPVTATLFNGMSSRLQNGEKSPESSGAESDGSDKLAPGIERKNSSSSLFTTPLPFPFDYEQKKLLAMKAMQKHPEGESRIPTDIWSGMGFSKSMPESAIRDRLGQLGISHARFDDQGPLQTHSEFAEAPPDPPHPESDSDIDRDPWKDSKTATDPYLNKAPGEYPSLRRKYDYGMNHQSLTQQQQQQRGAQQMMTDNSGGKVDLAELFSKLGLGKYTDLFQQQEIDLATFLTMTDQDLKELGITTFGARRKMLLAIADLNKGHTLLQQAQPRPLNNPFSSNGAMSSSRRPDLASLSGCW
ncbi:protein bicaudal C homolog 1-B-like isoform X2 [Babylonia areolata]|uniref:protein bicaudal C homolog 1-B-like isoform X2 n=1 Tax=Babylonia areolata TaxID=304850 RepID=UPI003FD64B2F